MPYSSAHRFKKLHGIHYNTKLNIQEVADISQIPLPVLQEVFDEAYATCKYTPTAMLSVYSYCIGGKEYKRRHIRKTSSPQEDK
jgi:hypothetical protein